MPTAAFLTMGCKVNQYDTDSMHETMHRNGYTIVDANEIADVYVVNTCTVTNVADQKARNRFDESSDRIRKPKCWLLAAMPKAIAKPLKKYRE